MSAPTNVPDYTSYEWALMLEVFVKRTPQTGAEQDSMIGALLNAKLHVPGTAVEGSETGFSPAVVELEGVTHVIVFTRLADAQAALPGSETRSGLGADILLGISAGTGVAVSILDGNMVLNPGYVADLKPYIQAGAFIRGDR